MVRVLEVFGEPISIGGQESYVMSALTHMDLSEIKVDMFTPYYCDNKGYVEFIESRGGKITEGQMPFVVGGTRREIIPIFERYLKTNNYDVVHIHSGSISVLAYYARVASKSGIKKVIVHSHSSGIKENIKHILIKLYASRLFIKYATDYCACSVEAARWKFPASILPKVKILNNGVDLEVFKFKPEVREKLRKELEIDNETLVLGHVGRFTYEKNQVFLLDILKMYIEKHHTGRIKLILVGDGNELVRVKDKAKKLGLSKNVLFVGASNNVSNYMQVFDVFLFPSLYEGLGIVGIEAQATGLPVIASTGIPKTMKVTDNVKFISLDEPERWCSSIKSYNCYRTLSAGSLVKAKGFDLYDTSKIVKQLYDEKG